MNTELLQFIKDKKQARALDLGAGDFKDVFAMIRAGWDCFGVDLIDGTDLNLPYLSWTAPFDLVYSNYVLQRIVNQLVFAKTCFNNLKTGGNLFIQTFSIDDPIIKKGKGFTEEELINLFKPYFKNIEVTKFADSDEEHDHIILKLTATK